MTCQQNAFFWHRLSINKRKGLAGFMSVCVCVRAAPKWCLVAVFRQVGSLVPLFDELVAPKLLGLSPQVPAYRSLSH